MSEQFLLFLGVASLAALIWTFVNGILICKYLEKRNIKVNWWLFRFLIFKYVKQYKDLTLREQGQIGPLYYRITLSARIFFIIISITVVVLILSRT